MTNVTFKFDRLSNPSMKEKIIYDKSDTFGQLKTGQIIEVYFEKDGYSADFEIIGKQIRTNGDAVLWYDYTLKYIPRTTRTVMA